MKILFITRLFYPHIGGVETHVRNLSKNLKDKGQEITVLTEKYDSKLKNTEMVDGIKVVRCSYPHIKLSGLLGIWFEIFKKRKLILEADIIHIHDVFIWYLPFRFMYPKKKVFTTIHGLEWDNPLSKISVWQKKLAVKLSTGTIGVGKFLEKYLNAKFDLVTYGATILIHINIVKDKNLIVYVGRLEENTGLLKFLDWLKKNKSYKVDFCGDGRLKSECEKYGNIHGFTNPTTYYKKAKYAVPGGYLAALEALSYDCELKLFWNNKIKEDYWKMSPFYILKGERLKKWAKAQTWDKLANEHISLYKFSNHLGK